MFRLASDFNFCTGILVAENTNSRFALDLSGQAIRTPTFCRFARTDSRESTRRKLPIFEALGQIRANRVFSPIRIEIRDAIIRVIRVQSSLLSHVLQGRFAKRRGFLFESRINLQRIFERESRANRESVRENRPTKRLTV